MEHDFRERQILDLFVIKLLRFMECLLDLYKQL